MSNLEQGNTFGQLLYACRKRPYLCLAFALYKLWMIVTFQESTVFSSWESGLSMSLPTWIGVLAVSAITSFTIAACFKRTNAVFKQPWYLWMVSAFMSLGVTFHFTWKDGVFLQQEIGSAFFIISIIFISLGSIGLHIELGRIFGYLGMRKTIIYNVVALSIGIILVILLTQAPASLKWGILIMVPFVITALIKLDFKNLSLTKLYSEKGDEKLRVPIRFMATSFVQGISFGLICGMLFVLGPVQFDETQNLICIIIAVALVIVSTLILRLDFNRLIYQIGFCLISLGLFFMFCFGVASPFAIGMQIVGYFYLDLVLWGLGSYLIKNRKQPATWVSACPTGALMMGRTIGAVVGSLGLQLSLTEFELFGFAGLLAMTFLVAALFLSNSLNLKSGWGFIRPSVEDQSSLVETCRFIGQENGLTHREQEIMLLLIQGANRKMISERLHVSQNTIKTHTHSIYRKFDIHSQSDLLGILDKYEKFFFDLNDEKSTTSFQPWQEPETADDV